MDGLKRLSASDRRSQLLELGHQLFSSRRYSEISVDDIAQAAGVSKGLLYHYFPSKEEFFLAGVERGCEQLLAAVRPQRARPPIARLVQSVRGHLDYVEHNRVGYLNLFRGERAALPEIQRACDRVRREIEAMVFDALDMTAPVGGATRSAFRGYQGFVEALVLNWLEEERTGRKQIESLMVSALLTSLRSGLRLDHGAGSAALQALDTMITAERDYLDRELGVEL